MGCSASWSASPLLIWSAYRGWSVPLLAPGGAAIAVVFAGFPLLANCTQILMGGTAAYESARVAENSVPSFVATRCCALRTGARLCDSAGTPPVAAIPAWEK